MHITIVPCLSDNYAYLVHAPDREQALCVDPAQAAPVRQALDEAGLELVAILVTHHHWDHTGGNEALVGQYGDVRVYGHSSEQRAIAASTNAVDDGDELEVAGLGVRVFHVPGHTLGAVAYLIDDALFTGDTLFVAGCGRLFEGTAEQMHASLQKLAALPESTRLYCGHEYTTKNLRFAQQVEPGNPAVRAKLEQVVDKRRRGETTVPSLIGDELATNPFLRTDSQEIRDTLRDRLGTSPGPTDVFAAVRAAKDRF